MSMIVESFYLGVRYIVVEAWSSIEKKELT